MQEVDMGESRLEASLCKKLARPYLKNKPSIVFHAYNSSYRGQR
jgi:hypothetical protein